MTIGKAIVKIDRRHRLAAFIISIMTQIAIWNSISISNKLVCAFARPKLIPSRRTPMFTMPPCTSSALAQQSRPVRWISRSSKVQMMMSIVDDVTAEMKVAMKAKDTVTLGTIRLIRSAFANAAIELRTESLSDEQVRFFSTLMMVMISRIVIYYILFGTSLRSISQLTIVKSYFTKKALVALRKMAKMRKESIDMYESNGASDRADMERAELAVIERYLPAAVSDDIVREWAKEAMAEAGAIDNVGKVMGAFMKKHKSDVDGTIAQRIVKEEIEKMKQE
jgi:uncharacterized protein